MLQGAGERGAWAHACVHASVRAHEGTRTTTNLTVAVVGSVAGCSYFGCES